MYAFITENFKHVHVVPDEVSARAFLKSAAAIPEDTLKEVLDLAKVRFTEGLLFWEREGYKGIGTTMQPPFDLSSLPLNTWVRIRKQEYLLAGVV